MAIITCHSLKGNVQTAINYIIKKEKVAEFCVEGVGCNIHTAALEWRLKKEQGRERHKKSSYDEVTGYHFIQSFPAGSISYEEAYDIAHEWIGSILGGEHDYVIATHRDTENVHTHIIVNPRNNNTGKNMDIFFKRDIPLFKKFSDRVCVQHNKEVIEAPESKYERTYYEWLLKNKGDSNKDIIKKTIDEIIPKVKSYQEFVMYLRAIDFEVEDGTVQKDKIINSDNFKFSVNEKMIDEEKETESHYYVRVPYTKTYVYIPKDCANFTSNGKTMFVDIKADEELESFDMFGSTCILTGSDLKSNFEDKDKEDKGRKGLRIKPPGALKFIRCNRIEKNDFQEGYALEEILERIENNNRFISDPEVEALLSKKYSAEEKKKNKTDFYEKVGIKEIYKNSRFNSLSPKEKMVYAKMKNINTILDDIRKINERLNDKESNKGLESKKESLKNELSEVNNLLKKKETEFELLLQQQMEGILIVSDEEKNEFIDNCIKPLQESKQIFLKQIKDINHRIENKKETQNKYR